MRPIPFNKPYLSGKETEYIAQAVALGHISGDGVFTQRCHRFFESRYGYRKCLLTTSCTDALEMAALLFEIAPGDEVIVPSYTFVSTANAFVLRGARIVFADSEAETPNLDARRLEELVTPRTKAIVPVHYAGMACDMDLILECARRNDLLVVEDAAQAIESFYKGKPLGSIGHLAAFSFHETKNIMSGEGGMLVVNDERFLQRAEIIREKGTNRSSFFRGEVDKYGWIDVGSSFLPSDIIAAFLYAQLESLRDIQDRRLRLWKMYQDRLAPLERKGCIKLPVTPVHATNNAHMFYLLSGSQEERTRLIEHLKSNGIMAVFHYQPLHKSQYSASRHDGRELPNADRYGRCLLRLPLYYELKEEEVDLIAQLISAFYGVKNDK
jgi:dTDP-4-amino-4,6-dideoxygalactose transaminase